MKLEQNRKKEENNSLFGTMMSKVFSIKPTPTKAET